MALLGWQTLECLNGPLQCFFQKNNPACEACRHVVNEQKNFHFDLECVSLLKEKYVKFVLILTTLYLEPLKGKEIKSRSLWMWNASWFKYLSQICTQMVIGNKNTYQIFTVMVKYLKQWDCFAVIYLAA